MATRCARPPSAILLLGALAIAGGCAPLLPSPPSEAVRSDFGAVAIVGAQFPPELGLANLPAKDGAEGAQRGAAVGASAPLAAGLVPGDPVSALLLLALVPIGAVVGAVSGPSAVEPLEEVLAAEARARGTLDATAFQERMQDQVFRAMARIPARPATVLPGRGPMHLGDSPPYARLAAEGVDTVLEVAVVQVGLVGPLGINPVLSLAMTVRVRVFRTKAPSPVYEASLTSNPMELVPLRRGDPVPRGGRTLREWAEGEGSPLRQEVTRTMEMLAEKVVDEVFLLYRPVGKAR